MKKFMIITILVALFATGTTLLAQDQSLGLPGDNLNLYAVMQLFQESKTLEEFERSLNDQNSNINNLDLNGDNLVDYIKVIDYVDGNVHNIVLQDAINERENQDVAVFTVQRDSYERVQIQLTGDEALYGRDYIIEPIFDDSVSGQTPNPGYTGNMRTIDGRDININRTTSVEIAAWPLVRFIYLPSYVAWRSSWNYGYYPSYFHSWHPYYWDYYYGYHYNLYDNYYGHYRRWDNHRYTRWNDFYYAGRRSHSINVSSRIAAGNYKNTYSHPDQRREGEAMYNKMNPSQNRRQPSNNSTGNTMERRSNSGSSGGAGTITNRRSTNTITNKPATNVPSGQNNGTNRRTTPTVTNKPDANVKSGQNTGTNRRTTPTVTNKPDANVKSGQNAGENRQSTTTVTNKSVSKPRPEQNANTTRATKKSSTKGEGPANRRNSVNARSKKTVKQDVKTKDSETTKDSPRR